MIRAIKKKIRNTVMKMGYDIRPIIDEFWSDQANLVESDAALTIFDAGANRGQSAKRYHQMFPNATVTCIEPIPHLADQLRSLNLDLEVCQIALAPEDGHAFFYINANEDTSSLLATDVDILPESYVPLMRKTQELEVATQKIDSLMQQLSIDSIDILKMDIQGGEYGALLGANNALSSKRISVIATELFFEPFYKDQILFGEVAILLASYNYKLHRLYNMNFGGLDGRLQWADAIFVPQ